ncbi:MAG TPA: argininosuccinate synthase, partial [Thermoplasmatales archaeon]|nr:argininosuccinate synthase [Thermoplasmatales archaeon]
TNLLAHGCTAKGNYQIRFELTWFRFMPNAKAISPWKDERFLTKFKGRKDMIEYAESRRIPIDVTLEEPYSTDENLMHISYEAGVLENIQNRPDEKMFRWTKSPKDAIDEEIEIKIKFHEGTPIQVVDVNGDRRITDCIKMIEYLNRVGGECGIGRIDIVEDRCIGLKARCVYEAPAATILIKAHREIESITLDREVIETKELISHLISKLIYDGLWYTPEMKMLMSAIHESQKPVSGEVTLSLYRGNICVKSRDSPLSLYDKKLVSMDEEGDFDFQKVKGFIEIKSLRLRHMGEMHETLAEGI